MKTIAAVIAMASAPVSYGMNPQMNMEFGRTLNERHLDGLSINLKKAAEATGPSSIMSVTDHHSSEIAADHGKVSGIQTSSRQMKANNLITLSIYENIGSGGKLNMSNNSTILMLAEDESLEKRKARNTASKIALFFEHPEEVERELFPTEWQEASISLSYSMSYSNGDETSLLGHLPFRDSRSRKKKNKHAIKSREKTPYNGVKVHAPIPLPSGTIKFTQDDQELGAPLEVTFTTLIPGENSTNSSHHTLDAINHNAQPLPIVGLPNKPEGAQPSSNGTSSGTNNGTSLVSTSELSSVIMKDANIYGLSKEDSKENEDVPTSPKILGVQDSSQNKNSSNATMDTTIEDVMIQDVVMPSTLSVNSLIMNNISQKHYKENGNSSSVIEYPSAKQRDDVQGIRDDPNSTSFSETVPSYVEPANTIIHDPIIEIGITSKPNEKGEVSSMVVCDTSAALSQASGGTTNKINVPFDYTVDIVGTGDISFSIIAELEMEIFDALVKKILGCDSTKRRILSQIEFSRRLAQRAQGVRSMNRQRRNLAADAYTEIIPEGTCKSVSDLNILSIDAYPPDRLHPNSNCEPYAGADTCYTVEASVTVIIDEVSDTAKDQTIEYIQCVVKEILQGNELKYPSSVIGLHQLPAERPSQVIQKKIEEGRNFQTSALNSKSDSEQVEGSSLSNTGVIMGFVGLGIVSMAIALYSIHNKRKLESDNEVDELTLTPSKVGPLVTAQMLEKSASPDRMVRTHSGLESISRDVGTSLQSSKLETSQMIPPAPPGYAALTDVDCIPSSPVPPHICFDHAFMVLPNGTNPNDTETSEISRSQKGRYSLDSSSIGNSDEEDRCEV